MDDLIRRSDVLRAIDEQERRCPNSYYNGLMVAQRTVATIPAVDAVEVVRCRECQYVDIGSNDAEAWCDCTIFGAGVSEAKRTLPSMTLLEGITNAVLGLSGEAGECADMIKKMRYQGHPLEVRELILELGDVMWYVAAAATTLGMKLEDVGTRNIEKLRKRYPNGFDPERSRNRDEDLEGAGFEV